jgi:hypothetical protein
MADATKRSIPQSKTGRGGSAPGFVSGGNGGSKATKGKLPVPTNIGPTPKGKTSLRKPPSS